MQDPEDEFGDSLEMECAGSSSNETHQTKDGSDDSSDVSIDEPDVEEPVAGRLSEIESQVFSFETDHLALKNNSEYKSVLKLLVLLEAQRITAIEDLNKLNRAKREAHEDPLGFVKKLQEGSLELPARQAIPEVPVVDFRKYTISTKTNVESFPKETRLAAGSGPESVETKLEPTETKAAEQGESKEPDKASKSRTHNQAWTVEEQKRLEELLRKHPREAVEARRWRKIADELGNRTIKQVASRVQKYFIKLTRAGLDVPGRIPHIPKGNKKVRRVQSTLRTQSYYLSTFFPQHLPPVLIDDQPVSETPVMASLDGGAESAEKENSTQECSFCGNKLGNSHFRCGDEDCCDSPLFCSDERCHRESKCGLAGHSISMTSQSQTDADYSFSNHYLDPNYLSSTMQLIG